MKKTWIIGLLSCGLFMAAQAQMGIIGFNTSKPQGVLHIGGASRPATANPPSGQYRYVNQFCGVCLFLTKNNILPVQFPADMQQWNV
jgi:hypothetical protein